jgi:hypothetical protein
VLCGIEGRNRVSLLGFMLQAIPIPETEMLDILYT